MTLKHTRESLGLTQEQMAKLLGLSYQHHISDMERGLRPISKRTALILERIREENKCLLTSSGQDTRAE